jgi:hypothetical protein
VNDDVIREFAAEDLSGALAFIDELRGDVRRIYVYVWDENGWRFVYGDDRRYVTRLLGLVVRQRRFRLSAVDLTRFPEGPPLIVRDPPTRPTGAVGED